MRKKKGTELQEGIRKVFLSLWNCSVSTAESSFNITPFAVCCLGCSGSYVVISALFWPLFIKCQHLN